MAYSSCPSKPARTLLDRGRRSSAHDLLLASHIYIESRISPEENGYLTRACEPLSTFLSPKMYFPEGKFARILSHYPAIVAVLNSRPHVDALLALPPRAQLKFFTSEPIVDKKTQQIIGWQEKPTVALGRTLLEADSELSHWQAAVPYPAEEPEDDSPPPPPPPSDDGIEGTPYDLRPRSSHPDDDDDDDDDDFDFRP